MSKRKLLQLVQQRLRHRLGRPAHADDQRAAAPRLHAGIDPRFLRADRRGEEGKRHRRGAARAQHPRGSEPARAARHGRAAPAEGRHHQLSRRVRSRRCDVINNPEDESAGTRKVPFSRELFTSSATISWRTRRRSSSGCRPERKCVCAVRMLRHLHRASSGRERGEIVELRVHLRSGDARRRRTGRPPASRRRCTGCRRRTRWRPKCASTTGSSRSKIPSSVPDGQTFLDYSQSALAGGASRRHGRAEPVVGAPPARACSSSAARLLLRGSGFEAGRASRSTGPCR